MIWVPFLFGSGFIDVPPVALKTKPTIYLVIRGDHFKCLASATTAPTAKQAFSVLDLLQSDTEPATSKYDASVLTLTCILTVTKTRNAC
jgi:hypothetical protein